jgi:hypothetical protein
MLAVTRVTKEGDKESKNEILPAAPFVADGEYA